MRPLLAWALLISVPVTACVVIGVGVWAAVRA